ncbi:sulfatase [Nonomuraea sp. SYSU D8015]|uniref:sulfatase n=1 Tax=Nonomuraea sp. SYSU D8015 TaxID=2593644 RepID=UPI001660516B|nr:sulfatase [Nonomuraea sp. SYSU D8015]
MNLVLISLDTLRADVAYSGRFPAIERLRGEGATFTQAVSPSPLTPVSHATVLTGLQPPRHGIRHLFKEQLNPEVQTLAMLLSRQGYATGAVVSCPGMNAWYGHSRGFDHYDDWIPPLADGRDALQVVDVELRGTALKRAPLVTERALAWARTVDRPMFLFAHYFDAHWPYEAPEDVGVPVDNPYEGEAAYMDRSLGHLLDGLDLEDTLVVCFSDHGEDLGGWYDNDHAGERGHPEEKGHGALLFDATQLVPLIIRPPGGESAGRVIDAQVRLADVMPTILEFLGVPAPDTDGVSLVEHLRNGGPDLPAYCETYYREELAASDPAWSHLGALTAVRQPDRKVIWEKDREHVWVYDLVHDALEQNPFELVKEEKHP